MDRGRLRVILLTTTVVVGSLTFAASPALAGTTTPHPAPHAAPNVAVKALHPLITSVSPNRFSPRLAKTVFRIHLAGPEHVSFAVRNANGRIIEGPHTPGALGAGTHKFTWSGRNNNGLIAGDGLYKIVVTTTAKSGGKTLTGTASASVRLDATAPRLSGINGNGMTFYPVVDGYSDTFGPKVHASEGGSLWLEISTPSGSKVKVVAHPHAGAGTFQLTWNGRNTAGAMVPDGAYRYHFVAADRVGNRSGSANMTVYVSHQTLVNKSVNLTLNGNQGTILTSDASCTQYSYAISSFTSGVWLDNVCDQEIDGFQTISGNYAFAVPGAVRYNSIQVATYGESIDIPSPVGSIIYNYGTGSWDPIGSTDITQYGTAAWSDYGTVGGAGHVSAANIVEIGIGVPDSALFSEDYDVGAVGITVSYQVLQ
jgi:flagellar hook assembly protein FlgD